MARKLQWPPPPEERWKEERERWRTLPHEEKTEVLRDWSENQDVRLARMETLLRIVTKLFWMVLAAFLTVAAKDIWGRYQIIRSGQVVLPAPNSGPSLAPDRVPPPASP